MHIIRVFSLKNIGTIPENLKQFQDDVFSMTQFMSILGDCVNAMDRGLGLEKICIGIRRQLREAGCRTNGLTLEDGVRTRNIPGDNIIAEMASKVTTIDDDFEKLSKQFQEALSQKDETEFIKKCADFHFDFVRVHPFTDANGRTSRILLSMMLATKNYMLPSLYSTTYEKCAFYERSNTALEGDYSTIEHDLFERLGHFYPLVMPRLEKQQNEVSSSLVQDGVGIEDIEDISNGVSAQERIDGINGMKVLTEQVQHKDKVVSTEQGERQ